MWASWPAWASPGRFCAPLRPLGASRASDGPPRPSWASSGASAPLCAPWARPGPLTALPCALLRACCSPVFGSMLPLGSVAPLVLN
ncbi:MAG: hypothetical protein [Microviridae sp.]|nr:MAG: hypothetical protein [Microviridae sp.]